jgi:hypothetical protein
MTDSEAEALGPIDWILIEWTEGQPTGEAVPHLLDLVDRGLVRLLDVQFMTKDDSGTAAAIELNDLGEHFAVFDGASTGIIGDEELAEAAEALEPGTSAALLVWENRWAAPFAAAMRRSGGEVVSSGRIPVQAIEAALQATEPAA